MGRVREKEEEGEVLHTVLRAAHAQSFKPRVARARAGQETGPLHRSWVSPSGARQAEGGGQ